MSGSRRFIQFYRDSEAATKLTLTKIIQLFKENVFVNEQEQ